MLDASAFGLTARAASESHLAFAGRRLRQACIACELAPGSFVHEAELAHRYGLGRAAVRVALTELAVSGLVSRHARQGWQVSEIGGSLARSVIEGRRLLEPALLDASLDEGQRMNLRNWRAMMQALDGRDDAQARTMMHRLNRQALDLLSRQVTPLVSGWLRELWDHAERLTRALELAARPVPVGNLGPFLDALLAGDRPAGLAALVADQARCKAALADAFLDAAQLAPAQARRRSRGARTSNFQPSPSNTVNEETSR
nr:GntR family transcriptional regulator [Methylobacterium sp. ZNC0032]